MAKTFYGDDTRPEIDHRINRYTLRCLRIILLAMVLVWVLNILNIFIRFLINKNRRLKSVEDINHLYFVIMM